MVKKSNGWNLQEMQETLVKDTEQRISDGFHEIASGQGGEKTQPSDISPQPSSVSPQTSSVSPLPSSISPQTSEQEPTKGVQTYIPMSMYRRPNDIKLTRRENIAALVAQAIALWLDVQEGQNSNSVTL
jgi:hypothetical protein